jgi:GNAT superfamily N-acetyltransferase
MTMSSDEGVKVMQEIEIRGARPEDLASIRAVFKSHTPCYDWKFAKRHYLSYFDSPELRAKEEVLVGLVGDRVVGVIAYLHDVHEADDIYWLGWFYVHKDEQGNQHGKRLLDHVVDVVKKRGGRKLYTDTSSWGFYSKAHHRYKEYGFKEEARLLDYYEKGEHQVIYGMTLR